MSNKVTHSVASLIFLSRWLQAPMYLGLIVALGVAINFLSCWQSSS